MFLPHSFHPGQRWISVSEPNLGLGEVRAVAGRTVSVVFRAANETRQYAIDNAPLRRAEFRTGDTIRTTDRTDVVIDAVVERGGIFYYQSGGREISETTLNDALSFSSPTKRLFSGQFDPPDVFDLRVSALHHQHERRRSGVRGFIGGRIDLLPHQLSIAAEVTRRLTPRVLLADEVGLGKTIEACLILHRLILTGRARRVLIIVPESLVHQWFLELLRRFNLWFHIFDEGRCVAIESSDPGVNPFLEHQLVVCDLDLFTASGRRLAQAREAGWDLLVVDEAHHLRWSPAAASPEYGVVEMLGRDTPGLLLLTATPEQLGIESHFARLRLLDPERFHDLDVFARESDEYRAIAALAQSLQSGELQSANQLPALAGLLGETETALASALAGDDEQSLVRRQEWIDALLDRHGTGRVMFRNTRAAVTGFPIRIPMLHALEIPANDRSRFKALGPEWAADSDPSAPAFRPNFTTDPRIEWLAGFLRTAGQDKVLLICRSETKAVAIEAAMRQRVTIPLGVFHEGMSLIQRDRSAASFAEPGGLRLLICSEIGSEGRNFQFAHHLVLFDLPLDPGLLEQRIGRLDRIGQTAAVTVHVPFIVGSHLEVLARWYHEGLNAFAENLQGGRELAEQFDAELRQQCARAYHERKQVAEAAVEPLIARGRAARLEVAARLEQGRDRLLEWHSFRPDVAARIVTAILRSDFDRALESFMLSICELYFIEIEEVLPRTYRLGSAGVLRDTFPGLRSDGLTITADRQRALAHEDLQFLTWDHPLASGALDLLLGSEHGNCSFGRWVDGAVSGLYLEVIYMLECVAPPALHLDRFLPPTPIRVVVNHKGQDAGAVVTAGAVARLVRSPGGPGLLGRADVRDTLLPGLLEQSRRQADSQVGGLIERARAEMTSRLGDEADRLRELQKVNRSVRDDEIELLETQRLDLATYISAARLRLDAVRLIHRGPER
jgi:ATP-dependent helicase HepA